jgi:hypothetical protein
MIHGRRLSGGPVAALLAAVLLTTGCGKKIGDDCLEPAECSPNGDRICDRSQPDGYCTVDGCDERSCPEDSVCIRFFPAGFLTKPCDPEAEDLPGGRDDCHPEELCLASGLCAPRASERRYCAATCNGNDDCRGGYECRVAGTRGTAALTPNSSAARFCAPR